MERLPMSTKKTIAVFGATGAQGGGLVRAILADPSGGFAVRAVTRDVGSDKAKALAAAGADVVAADVDDPGSVERALKGCYGAYFVTFFWAHFSAEKEMAEVEGFARAAKAAGLKHAIWSTLEDTRKHVPLSDPRMPTLHGKYKVPHFDGKGASDHFFTDAGVPTTFLVASFYWDNFIHFGAGPKANPDGTYTLALPMEDKKMSGVAAEDIGAVAYGIFKAGPAYIGKTVGVAGEHLTGAEMAAGLARAMGKTVNYYPIKAADYRALGFPGADDLGNMFQFYAEFADMLIKTRDIPTAKKLHPGLMDFADWLKKYGAQIPR
jgi:uncharacterized protein YbjT (DUF2867 family)